MKLIVSGVEHEFIGEPTPKELHTLCLEMPAIPVAKELYSGELGHLYKANGWQFAGMLITREQLGLRQIVERLHEEYEHIIASLGSHALIGPVEHTIMSEHSERHGASLWVQPQANQAVTIGESTLH